MLMKRWYSLFFLFFVLNSFGQSIPNKEVSINTKDQSFKQIITRMEDDYGLSFSYSDDILPTHQLPEFYFEKILLSTLLDTLFVSHGINYTFLQDKIILYLAKKMPLFTLSGFVEEEKSLENLIGTVIYSEKDTSGGISNAYGFYSLKLSAGYHTLKISCLGYKSKKYSFYVLNDNWINFKLTPTSYEVEEVLVKTNTKEYEFLEQKNRSKVELDIETLKQLPGFFGENDALRNLSLIAGVQSNEMSTGSIFVRGGTTEQTLFLMDEATIYNPTHFFGFFSVFNPDVIKYISVYKNELPNNESGALSSVIDVRLREGNYEKWKISGALGFISARVALEGPIIKNKSSVLIAFRRTFVDNIFKLIASDKSMQKLNFFFYDGNLKFNYRLNKKNRLFLSGYSGSDAFSQYNSIKRQNSMVSLRWNHIHKENLFSNTSAVYSTNTYNQYLQQNDESINWKSTIYNLKLKTDFVYHLNKNVKFYYGYSSSLFNIAPYKYKAIYKRISKNHQAEALKEQLLLNSIYFNQEAFFGALINFNLGLRITHIFNSPFLDRKNKYAGFMFEPNVKISYFFNPNNYLAFTYNHRVQPLHQLYVNKIGIAVNRWMPASTSFKPQTSDNFSIGFHNSMLKNFMFSTNIFYRDMNNLIETMQEIRILYSSSPEKYFYHSSGKVYGAELSAIFYTKKYKAILSYDFNQVMWKTENVNNNKAYPASHSRKHNFSISGIWKINKRFTASATWIWASGTPYTAATGKYEIDGKLYLKYDKDRVNQWNLPDYHRLDVSLEIQGKKNDKGKWNSFWNFSIYNVYFHRNILGISYFSGQNMAFDIGKDLTNENKLNPQFFYLYQFVPSISYRFNF